MLGYPLATFGALLGIWCVITALVAHRGDINQFLAHVGMTGGFFAFATASPGALALFGSEPTDIWSYLP